MTTPFIRLAIEYQTKVNKYLGRFPLEWNPKERRYSFENNYRNLLVYYWDIIVFLCTINFGGCALIVILRYLKPMDGFTNLHLFVFVLVGGAMGMALGLSLFIFLYGETSMKCVNVLLDVEEKLESEDGVRNVLTDGRMSIKKDGLLKNLRKPNGNFDLLGITLLYFVSLSWTMPPFITTLGLLAHLDPWYWLAMDFLGAEIMAKPLVRLGLISLSFPVLFINAAQCVRLIQTIVIMVIIPMQQYIHINAKLDELFNRTKKQKEVDEQHLWYTKLTILNDFSGNYMEPLTYALMQFGYIMSIICLFCLLKLYEYAPLVVYLSSFLGLIVSIVMIRLCVPVYSRIYERSSVYLHKWKGSFGPRRKYFRLKYKALRPLRIHAGMMGYKFFMFERSVTLEYAMAIVDQTVNIMMSTDETWLSEMGGGI